MNCGAVAIWHDIAPEGLAEFHAWHGEEHMPERVGIPGFVRGRRFVAIEADLGYFNLYDTASPEVVNGPDYKARLDNPTPRTLSAVRHFRNVARSLCEIVARTGDAQGGVVATLRHDVADGRDAEHIERMTGQVMRGLAAMPGVASVALLVADKAASSYVNAEQRARGAANRVPPYILVVEGWCEEEAFIRHLQGHFNAAACAELAISTEHSLGFYRHQLTVNPATST